MSLKLAAAGAMAAVATVSVNGNGAPNAISAVLESAKLFRSDAGDSAAAAAALKERPKAEYILALDYPGAAQA